MTTRLEGRAWRNRRAAVLARSNVCHLCDGPIDMTLSGFHPLGPTVDHIVPVNAGGSNELSNLAPAHRHCNLTKGDRHRTPPRTEWTW